MPVAVVFERFLLFLGKFGVVGRDELVLFGAGIVMVQQDGLEEMQFYGDNRREHHKHDKDDDACDDRHLVDERDSC